MAKKLNRHPIIKKLNKLNPDVEENDRIIKDLGKGLKNEYLTFKQHNNLFRLGRAILTGELTDNTHGEDFKLIGKAIIEQKLNKETKNLLRKVLLSSKNKTKRSLKKLIEVLKNSENESNIHQNNTQFQNDGVFFEALASDSELQKAGSENAEDYKLRILIDTIFRSNESLNKNHNQDIIMLLQNSFRTNLPTDDKYNKTLGLLEMALTHDKQKGDPYQKILELFVDSMKKGQPIEIDNQEILKYINHVLNPKAPSDNATIEKLAEIHSKDNPLSFNRYGLLTSKTDVNQESPHALHINSVPKNFPENDRNENKVSSISKNGSSGGPNSTTVVQNAEKASIKITKKRSKRSSKSNIKSTTNSNQSNGKTKKSSKKKSDQTASSVSKPNLAKKSSKKTKKSRRSTEDGDKQKSKNKEKKKTQKLKQ